jgi:hypothetical protein
MWDTQVDLEEAPFSAPELVDYRAQNTSFENIAADPASQLPDDGRGEAERIRGEVVTPEYLDVLGVKPLLDAVFRSKMAKRAHRGLRFCTTHPGKVDSAAIQRLSDKR